MNKERPRSLEVVGRKWTWSVVLASMLILQIGSFDSTTNLPFIVEFLRPAYGETTFVKFVFSGGEPNTISSPVAIATDSSDRILVVDTDNERIQVFDKNGNFLFKFGSFGSDDGQFNSPQGIAVDSSDRILVADTGNDRIQVFQTAATITIIKDTVPDDGQDFSYTTTGGLTPNTFSLDDDSEPTLSNAQTYNNVAPGSYSVTEAAVSGFTLSNLTCDDPDSGTTVNISTAAASIDLDAGETVTCTYENTAKAVKPGQGTFTITGIGSATVKKSSISQETVTVKLKVSGSYQLGSSHEVNIGRDLDGTLNIFKALGDPDDNLENIRITISNDSKMVRINAKLVGFSDGRVSVILKFKSPIDFENGIDIGSKGENTLLAKLGGVTYDTQHTTKGRIIVIRT